MIEKDTGLMILLEVSALCPAPLEWVLPTFNENAFNVCLPAEACADPTGALERALELDLLRVQSIGPIGDREVFRSDLSLTSKGARLWETLAQPKWNDYLIDEYGRGRGFEVTGLSRERIEQWLQFEQQLTGEYVITETVQWDVVRPYEATYWKSFGQAYRIRGQFGEEKRYRMPTEEAVRWKWEMCNWYSSWSGRTPWEQYRRALRRPLS